MHAVGTSNPIPSYLQSLLDTDNHAGPNALPASFRDSIGKVVAQKPALPCSPEHMCVPKYGSRADKACGAYHRAVLRKRPYPGIPAATFLHGLMAGIQSLDSNHP